MQISQMDHAGISVFSAALATTNAKVLEGRVPAIGSRVEFSDGRVFRYVSSAVNIAAGQIVGRSTALATPIDNLCTAAAAGDYDVILSLAGTQLFGGTAGVLAANRLAGGYLIINDDDGEGHTYRIRSNTVSTAATLTTTITLYEPLRVALTTASDVFIVGPKFDSVAVGTATLPPVGVAVVPCTAGTAGNTQQFWVQSRGLCGVVVKTGTNIAIGKGAAADADGGCKLFAAEAIPIGVFAGTETTATATVPVELAIE